MRTDGFEDAGREGSGFGLCDRYVLRICLGSYAVCLVFLIGLLILMDLLLSFDTYAKNLAALPSSLGRQGFFLVLAYYFFNLPFFFLSIAPYVTVTSAMFAIGRLMGANEIVPMLFTGRSLTRILRPLFLVVLANIAVMFWAREYLLPSFLPLKDDYQAMLRDGEVDRVVRDKVVRLGGGETIFFDRYRVRSRRMEGLEMHVSRGKGRSLVRADAADYREDGPLGAGWYLEGGRRSIPGTDLLEDLRFHPLGGLDPNRLRKELKERREVLDLTYSDLLVLVREKPEVPEYVLALHGNLTFPLANLLLVLLALPFALRFERGSKLERIAFALVVCGAYLVTDLIFRNLGAQGTIHPVIAAWFPTILFGSLGIVLFDGVRT